MWCGRPCAKCGISIHALREEGDPADRVSWADHGPISIHALREEGDYTQRWPEKGPDDFYPRPPRGGRPSASPSTARRSGFLSTPSARRATCSGATLSTGPSNFYPRPPRGGRRVPVVTVVEPHLFLSTPSARRATAPPSKNGQTGGYFYPRPPRGGRPARAAAQSGRSCISIHALREEGDLRGPEL